MSPPGDQGDTHARCTLPETDVDAARGGPGTEADGQPAHPPLAAIVQFRVDCAANAGTVAAFSPHSACRADAQGGCGVGLAILIVAIVPAYLAGAVALFLGAGWLFSLAVLSGTGVLSVIAVALVVTCRDLMRRDDAYREIA